MRSELQYQGSAIWVLEVNAHTSLVEVPSKKGRADSPTHRVLHRRKRSSPGFPVKWFYLDDIRAEAPKELGCERQRLHLLECKYSNPGQRCFTAPFVGLARGLECQSDRRFSHLCRLCIAVRVPNRR